MPLITNISTQGFVSTKECKYTWIDFWNNLIEFSNNNVVKGKHIYRLKSYENSFNGTNIIDTVYLYLCTCKNEYITEITREKALKLCQLMLNCKILFALNDKSEKMEDSKIKIYKFNAHHEVFIKINSPKTLTPSRNLFKSRLTSRNTSCRSLNNLSLVEYEDDIVNDQYTPNFNDCSQSNIDKDVEIVQLQDGQKVSWQRRSSLLLGSITKKCEKYWYHSTPDSKNGSYIFQKQKRENVTESLYNDENDKNGQRIKENALSELTKILDIPLLDDILKYSIQNSSLNKTHFSRCLQFIDDKYKNGSDNVWLKGLACLRFFKEENILNICDSILAFDNSLQLQKIHLYNCVYGVYAEQKIVIWPNVYHDVHLGLLRQLSEGPLSITLHAFNLALVLLGVNRFRQLITLLEFLKAVMIDSTIKLSDMESNRSVIIKNFTMIIIHNKSMNSKDTGIFVAFLIDHADHFFIKKEFKLISNSSSCIQISKEKYESNKQMNTNEALVEMMQHILNDNKISLKDKKCKLSEFHKFHRHLFIKFFKDFKF